MARGIDRQQARWPRHGTRPYQVLHILTGAQRAMRAEEINAPDRVAAPTQQIVAALEKLKDKDLVTYERGLWVATQAGFAAALDAAAPSPPPRFMSPSIQNASIVPPHRRDFESVRVVPPLVLRPGAEDYRQHPSRRGSTLVWDHLDGRKGPFA